MLRGDFLLAMLDDAHFFAFNKKISRSALRLKVPDLAEVSAFFCLKY
jgi:hypothetical protein